MLNFIWVGMLVIGVVVGALTGNIELVTEAAISNAETAVDLAIGLIGVMALWLGLMKIAEKSGLVDLIGRALRPVIRLLFPDIPEEHPANGSIVMSMSANLLGLGNAATPLGIKAMKELQELNDDKETASDSMCMFLAINTSSVTLISSSVIAYRAAAGSVNATEIIGPTLVATIASTAAAIIAVKVFQRIYRKKNK